MQKSLASLLLLLALVFLGSFPVSSSIANDVPIETLLHRSITLQKSQNPSDRIFLKKLDPKDNYLDACTTIQIYDEIPPVRPSCLDAFTTNLLAGDCELGYDCLHIEKKVLDHHWYKGGVSVCYGVPSFPAPRPVKARFCSVRNRGLDEFSKKHKLTPDYHFDLFYRVEGDKLTPYYSASLVYYDIGHPDFDSLHVTPDWHSLKYYAPDFLLWEKTFTPITLTSKQIIERVSFRGYEFDFECGQPSSNSLHLFSSSVCDPVYINSTHFICADIFSQQKSRSKICPVDYLIKNSTLPKFSILPVRISPLSFQKHLAEWVKNLLVDFTHVAVAVVRPIVKVVFETSLEILATLLPPLLTAIESLLQTVPQLAGSLARLLSTFFATLFDLFLVVDTALPLTELLFVYVLFRYVSGSVSISMILSLFLLSFHGLERLWPSPFHLSESSPRIASEEL